MVRGSAVWLFSLVVAGVFAVGCGGSKSTTTTSGTDAGSDATTPSGSACTTNEECQAKVPATTPANCATATCNAVQGTCVFAAKDDDGDGHTAAVCKSKSTGITIVVGDDCNDHDANLYPGHPEPCNTSVASSSCSELKCLADGTESSCTANVTCPNQACVKNACTGTCAPNATQCDGTTQNSLQTCGPDGTWGTPMSCGDMATCVTSAMGASCTGMCAAGTNMCVGTTGSQTCSPDGVWGPTVACNGQTCNNGLCLGTCTPGETACSGNGVVTCNMGSWSIPLACSNQTCVGNAVTILDGGVSGPVVDGGATDGGATTGMCQGVCVVGTLGCDGAQQPQICDATGAWQNTATMCTSGQVCQAGTCQAGCVIAGAFYAAAATNPNNACQSCQVAVSTSSWSNLPNGFACGNGQTCAAGQCGSGCDISGATYMPSVPNPMNACQTCQPGTSTTSWTNLANGTACGTGEVCDVGTCAAGCDVGGVYYGSGAMNPSNACQTCQPAMTSSGWTTVSVGTNCGPGEVCNGATCTAACFINGNLLASAAINSANACQSCQPAIQTTGWTNVALGTACAAGEVCSGSTCAAGCFIGGVVYSSAQQNPMNACQSCQPGVSTTAWTNVTNGTTCASGKVCAAGACVVECDIGGTLYTSGTTEPGTPCESCQPSVSTTTWSTVTLGTSCGASEVCNGANCISGCFVAGAIYASGQTNMANACQSCQPAVSTTALQTAPDGTSCGNGQVCAGGACGSQCVIAGTKYATGTLEPGNPCASCQPGTNTAGWSPLAQGTSCGAGEVCNSTACISGCFIGGTVYPANTINPGNSCESCQPGSSTTGWSNITQGTGCGPGSVCVGSSCSAGCFILGTYYAPNTINPGNYCQSCQPGVSTTTWQNLSQGTSCQAGATCVVGGGGAVCTCISPFYRGDITTGYTAPVTLNYTMVGGGGGGGVEGGGGGSTGIVLGNPGSVIAEANGGAGGANGQVVNGSFSLPVGGFLNLQAGGGGGDTAGGGGAGLCGGGGGTFDTATGVYAVGGGGTTVGGTASPPATAGNCSAIGGTGFITGPGGTVQAKGGAQGTGGTAGINVNSGGGGAWGGGGGGSDGAGGAQGANGGGSGAGLGASNWTGSLSMTLPAAAGEAGSGVSGGNAGLIIFVYAPPTGEACF